MTQVTIIRTADPQMPARLHRETVVAAYAGYFPAGARPPPAKHFISIWKDRLSDQRTRALLALVHVRPAGLVAVGRSAEAQSEGELVTLFVLPAHWQRGIGSSLHAAGLRMLVDADYTAAGLWVIEANARAHEFYEARGWHLVPDLVTEPYEHVPEVRYRRSL